MKTLKQTLEVTGLVADPDRCGRPEKKAENGKIPESASNARLADNFIHNAAQFRRRNRLEQWQGSRCLVELIEFVQGSIRCIGQVGVFVGVGNNVA